MKLRICLLSLSLILIFGNAISQEEPSVFSQNRGTSDWLLYKNNNQALYNIITNEAFKLLNEREVKVSKLETKEDWMNYQTKLHSKLFTSAGKFKKTPLNEKVT
jgi:hypothetical protein